MKDRSTHNFFDSPLNLIGTIMGVAIVSLLILSFIGSYFQAKALNRITGKDFSTLDVWLLGDKIKLLEEGKTE